LADGEISDIVGAILYRKSAGFVTAKPFTSMAARVQGTARTSTEERMIDVAPVTPV